MVRLSAQTVQNVVTYTAVIGVKKPGSGAPPRHDGEPSDRHRRARRTCCVFPTRPFASDLPSPWRRARRRAKLRPGGASAARMRRPSRNEGTSGRIYRLEPDGEPQPVRCPARRDRRQLTRKSSAAMLQEGAAIIVGKLRAPMAATDAGDRLRARAARAPPRCSEDRAVALIETRDLKRVYDLDAGRVVALDRCRPRHRARAISSP